MKQRSEVGKENSFAILSVPKGYVLKDTDSFNNWGLIGQVFKTVDEARAYAVRCDRFKRGKSMNV